MATKKADRNPSDSTSAPVGGEGVIVPKKAATTSPTTPSMQPSASTPIPEQPAAAPFTVQLLGGVSMKGGGLGFVVNTPDKQPIEELTLVTSHLTYQKFKQLPADLEHIFRINIPEIKESSRIPLSRNYSQQGCGTSPVASNGVDGGFPSEENRSLFEGAELCGVDLG